MGDPNTGEIYQDALRKSTDIGLSHNTAKRLESLPTDLRIEELQQFAAARDQSKPDLRTLEGAIYFLDYHAPNDDTLPRHAAVNAAFQTLIRSIWNVLPDGPGKTVTIRAVGRARMECNSCIANGGQ